MAGYKKTAGAKKAKRLVVAVDDSGIILKMIEKVLSERYEFHAFSNGKRALLFLQDRTPDVIILDIDMPEMNGYEMLERIRKKDYLENVPVIFLTSNADKKHVVKAIEGGANDYIIKPIDEDILLDKVRALIADDESDSENDTEYDAGSDMGSDIGSSIGSDGGSILNEMIEDE